MKYFFLFFFSLTLSYMEAQINIQAADQDARFTDCRDQLHPEDSLGHCADAAFIFYLMENLTPANQKLEGQARLYFSVGQDGSVREVQVQTDLSKEIQSELESALKDMPTWLPAEKAGQKVASSLELELIFPLVENEALALYYQPAMFVECPEEAGKKKKKRKKRTEPHDPFKCAEREMLFHIYRNIQYPAEARNRGIQGAVVIQFMVQADGSLTDFEYLETIGGGCDEESMRVLKQMPNWVPAKAFGVPVSSLIRVPVKFKLQ